MLHELLPALRQLLEELPLVSVPREPGVVAATATALIVLHEAGLPDVQIDIFTWHPATPLSLESLVNFPCFVITQGCVREGFASKCIRRLSGNPDLWFVDAGVGVAGDELVVPLLLAVKAVVGLVVPAAALVAAKILPPAEAIAVIMI